MSAEPEESPVPRGGGSGLIENSVNSGYVTGGGILNVGGIAGFSAQPVTGSANYGEIESFAHNDNAENEDDVAAVGGISGLSQSDIDGCENYGRIFGDTRVGGIAGACADVTDSVNYGRIEGTDTQGGIAGEVNSSLYGCNNYGEIHGNEDRTGGVAGRLRTGTIELCANYGVVSGAENNEMTSNFTGGIVGRAGRDETKLINVYNTVEVAAPYGSIGGAGCSINTDISGFVINLGAHNVDGNQGNRNFETANFYWRDNEWGTDKWPEDILDLLNADGDVWVMGGEGYPVFEKDIPSDGAEHVKTADDLAAALSGAAHKDIAVDGVIEVSGDLTVSGEKRISGGQIKISGGSIVVNGSLTLGNISIRVDDNSVPAVKVNGGTLTTDGIVDANSGVTGDGGEIDFTDGMFCDGAEDMNNPSVSGTARFSYDRRYSEGDGGFYLIAPENDNIVTGLAALAADNPTLPFDVYASVSGDTARLFMPGTADLTDVTFTGINGKGEPIGEKHTEDLSSGQVYESVRIDGFEYKVEAMQSSIPTLSFSINEEYGTIAAMNTSTDHSVKCYGDAAIYVPEALKEKNGWDDISSLDYQDKDPEKAPGTMEIKGRGNSTWVADLTTKKPYQFKFEKKADVLGMGENKTWIILRNDNAYIRNKLAFDLGAEMGMENTSKGEFVDVFMNGEYLGNYLLCEKVQIGKTRVDISDLDDEYETNNDSVEGLDLTGGYLLEIDNWDGDALQIQYDKDGGNENIISIKEPEDLAKEASPDEGNPYSYIYNYTTDFFDAVYGDGIMSDGRSYLEHIDRESFAVYFLHQEFLRNKDCGIGSTYLYKDRDSIDPLIYAGPFWDNDRAISSWTYDDWAVRDVLRPSGSVSFYNRLIHRPDFAALVVDYYKHSDLNMVFANASGHIREYNDYAGDSFNMDALRWGTTVDNEWMMGILDKRAEWIDANYEQLLTLALEDPQSAGTYVISDVSGNKATVSGSLDGEASGEIIGALYDSDGALVETKTVDADIKGAFNREISFSNNAEEYTVKAFIWNGKNKDGMKPIFNAPAADRVPWSAEN